ncbi:MAG: hypothetical protein ACI920_003881, partial [Saprospiraceae bacterium]
LNFSQNIASLDFLVLFCQEKRTLSKEEQLPILK